MSTISALPPPKSHHLTDPSLQPFLSSSFDPATYLNNTLAPLSLQPPSTSSLSALTTQTTTLTASLTAQTTRLSHALTALTDDILRSGARLAYDVELLRGETLSLADSLNDTLQPAIKQLIPEGLDPEQQSQQLPPPLPPSASPESPSKTNFSSTTPAALPSLRTLHLVRNRLQSVLATFSAATAWAVPPTITTFEAADRRTAELDPVTKDPSTHLRTEVSTLLSSGDISSASARVAELRELLGVWRGTGEEKARRQFVEALEGMIEAEKRKRELEGVGDEKRGSSMAAAAIPGEGIQRSGSRAEGRGVSGAGRGFLTNLQRLRNEIYLE